MIKKTEIDYLNYNDLNEVEAKIKEYTDRANEAMSPQINKIIDGKSTQETTTGKNLLPNTATTKTISGLTFIKNEDGTILVKGTASANVNFDVGTIDNLTLGNTYHLCGCPSGGSPSTYRLFMSDITTGSTSEFGSGSNYAIQNAKVVVRIIIQNGTTVNNLLYKPMVSTDTTLTYDDYEPYTGGKPSPNPDYPSEIENVKGKNLLDNKNPNYIVGATWQPTETGGKFSASTTWKWVGWNLKLNMNKQYTFSYGARNSKNVYLYIRTYTDSTYTTIKTKIVNDGANLQYTFKPDSEYVRISFANNAVIENIEIPNIQLEKGSVATRYVPYGNIQIVETGKNLFDINISEWGKYNVWKHNAGNAEKAFVNVTNIKGLDKCSISFKNNTRAFRFGYQFIDDNENYLSGYYWSAPTNEKIFANISVPENASKIIISQLDGKKEDDIKIQLERGPIATDYEPYTEEIVKIDLKGNELCSLPNGTKDELIVKDGRAKIIKRIGKVILDGSENWYMIDGSVTTPIYKYFVNNDDKTTNIAKNSSLLMCNYFEQKNIWGKDNIGINYEGTATTKSIRIRTNITTVDEFKTWLSTHNTIVQYELAEPYEIDLGPLEVYFTYETKKWVINELPYIQEIDRIEKGIYNLGEKYNRPKGWLTTKEWITKDNLYPIKSFDYRDWNRWVNNLNLFTTDIVVKDTIWNSASFINWEQIGKSEWR